jgi:predicted phage terminase large subunit-like protein
VGRDVVRERWEYPDLKRNFISFCEKHQPNEVLIEDKGNGTALIQDLRRDPNFKWPIIPIEPEGDKIMRAQRTSPAVRSGASGAAAGIAPWLGEFEMEITRFPLVDFMDQVDMLTQFLDRFGRGDIIKRLLGKKTAAKFFRHFNNRRVYLARCTQALATVRARQVRADSDSMAMAELQLKYDMSERQIYRILKADPSRSADGKPPPNIPI